MSNSMWISPSFDDVLNAPEDSCSSYKRTSARKLNQLLPSSSTKPNSVVKPVAAQNGELWVNKYSPQNVEELAVHKNKVADLRNWFLTSLSSCPPKGKAAPILLITGDTGTGKTAAVRLVAKELQVEVKEWVNVDTFTAVVDENGKVDYESSTLVESQTSKFSSFLHRASRYSSLGLTSRISDAPSALRHVVLVEEFPNVFLYRPSTLHGVLRHYHVHGLCPIIFIVSDCAGKSNEHLWFPKSIQEELRIDNIAFNPVAPTMALKVLMKITEREEASNVLRMNIPDRDTLQLLVKTNQGDIRAAINALEFYCQGSHQKTSTRAAGRPDKRSRKVPAKTRGKVGATGKLSSHTETDIEHDLGVAGGKDPVLSLFHAVGKILHCKRKIDSEITENLPSHLSHFRRKSLLVDPEEAVEKAHVATEQFVAFLHQNYVEFHSNIDDVVMSSGYISDSDCLTDWSTRSAQQSYCLSLATRGLLFSNADRNDCAVGWKPINKPQLFAVVKQATENSLKVKDAFPFSRLSLFELQTEFIPYVSIIGDRRKTNEAKLEIVRSIGSMTGRRTDFQRLCDDDLMSLQDDLNDGSEMLSKPSAMEESQVPSDSNTAAYCNMAVVEDEEIIIDDYD